MTIKELIEKLKELQLSEDTNVCVAHHEWIVKKVEVEKDMLILK